MSALELIRKLRQEQEAQVVYVPNPAPAPTTTVTPQNYLNRLVATIDKVNERSIAYATVKDLSSLTTQAELFNAVEVNKYYIVKAFLDGTTTNPVIDMFQVVSKDATSAKLTSAFSGEKVSITFFAGNNQNPITWTTGGAKTVAYGDLKVINSIGQTINLSTMDGTENNKLLPTKGYVDIAKTVTDKLAGSTITFKDGTTLVL